MHQNNHLTYLVLKPKYFIQSRSIPWLLMPWLFVLPGHQQPWYWMCRINGSLSSTRKDFNYLRHIRIVKWFQYTKWIKLAAILRQPQCVNWWSWLFSYLLEISRCSAGCISTMSLLGIVLWWKAANTQRLLHSHRPLKYFGNSYQSHEQTICCNRDDSNVCLDWPITKEWCQPNVGHVISHTQQTVLMPPG